MVSDKKETANQSDVDVKQAHADAQTLANANLISSDPDRLKRAKQVAANIVKETKDKINPMKKVARGADVSKSTNSKTKKKKTTFNVFKKIG